MALDLGKMYGPLPLGGWLIAGSVGLGLFFFAKKESKPATQVIGGTPLGDMASGVGTGTVSSWVPNEPPVPATPNPNGNLYSDNDTWYQAAMGHAKEKLSQYNILSVDQALQKYMAGKSLDITETAIVSAIIKGIGPIPFPVPGGSITLPSDTTPSAIPATPAAPKIWANGSTVYVQWVTPSGKGLPINHARVALNKDGKRIERPVVSASSGGTSTFGFVNQSSGYFQAQVEVMSSAGWSAWSPWSQRIQVTVKPKLPIKK